jgi:NADH:ubiquinone oxidoreductase subunit E
MSLPIAGKPRPTRPATHTPLDLDRLMKLGVAVEDAAEDADEEQVAPEMLEELAEEMGTDVSQLLAATAMTTDLELARPEEVTFVCCAGGCQGWGALDRVEDLFDIRRERAEAGKALFNIHARNCLDRCQQAPVVLVHGPDGVAFLPEASRDDLEQAIDELCG